MPGECGGSWNRDLEKPRSPRTGQLHYSRPCHGESVVHPLWWEEGLCNRDLLQIMNKFIWKSGKTINVV